MLNGWVLVCKTNVVSSILTPDSKEMRKIYSAEDFLVT